MSHVAGTFTGLIRDRLAELDGETLEGEAPEVDEIAADNVAGVVTYINSELLPALAARGVITVAE
ncbi:hypothetical protein [Nocardiopsis protaetiae]|uniref:hypothetical protein n=1 Tax=Nocardiopsis protaetiae TaxID=3382270 RepID=UPI00387B8A94